jgi:hypothetical protein
MSFKSISFLAFVFSSILGLAQNSESRNPVKHKNLIEFEDPIDHSNWMTIATRVWSINRTGIRSRRICADFNFTANYTEEKWGLNMRFVINTNIEEWPLQSKAYIIVNDEKHEIKLKEAHSTYFNIKDEATSTDASGNTSTSISTRDFQLFKKESNLSEVLSDVKFIQNFSLVVYSADVPILFQFDEADMNRLQAVLR